MRRRLPLLRPLFLLGALFLVAIAAALFLVRFDRVVTAHGAFAGGTVPVRAPMAGRIVDVAVAPGERVAPGKLLVRFDDAPLEAEREVLRIREEYLERRVQYLQLELRSQLEGIQPAETEQARREAERSRVALEAAETSHRRRLALAEQGLLPDEELQNSASVLRLAELTRAASDAAVPLLEQQHGATVAELQRDLAELAGDRAAAARDRAELERRQALCAVTAAVEGVVSGAGLYDLEQRHVEEGAELMRLQTGPAVRFEGRLDDHGRGAARVGQRARIRLDGFPWLLHGTIPAKVAVVGGSGDAAAGGFPVILEFRPGEGPGPPLDGMTGQARIAVGERVTVGRLLTERVLGVESP